MFRPSEEGANVTTRRSLAVRRQQLARPEGDLDRESHPGNNNEGPGEALFRIFEHFSAPFCTFLYHLRQGEKVFKKG